MRPFSRIAVPFLLVCIIAVGRIDAQGSAKELIAELSSGDSTRCMDAGNATSQHQEHYQQLAAELATPLFDILEKGPCAGSALTALVNVGSGIVEGVDHERGVRALLAVIEKGLAEGASYDAASDAGSALLVIGRFGGAAAPAVPTIVRWIHEREDSFDRRYALMALAEIGDAAAPAVPELLQYLAAPAEDDEKAWEKKELRTEVARSLGSIPAAASVSAPKLLEGLADTDYGYRYTVTESIAKIGAPMIPHLVPLLGTTDAETSRAVLEILTGLGAAASEAAPAIAPLLADEDWNVSYQAGEALREIGPTPDGITAIVKVLGNESKEDGASAAAEVLGGYGAAAKPALPALRKAAGSGNWSIADAAKTAIAAIEGGS